MKTLMLATGLLPINETVASTFYEVLCANFASCSKTNDEIHLTTSGN